jgi:hypothetical protein
VGAGAGSQHQPRTYDRIGAGYGQIRRTDVRLAQALQRARGGAHSVLNVGAGSGSYEPVTGWVVAAEPSAVMLAQHPGICRIQARAEELPFLDQSFDVAMAVMSVHHWDLERGLTEMKRVSRRQVVFCWDPDHETELWMIEEYLPELGRFERSRHPGIETVAEGLGAHTITPFLIPHDFADGFQHAFWRRPDAFLDPAVRAASSMYALAGSYDVESGIERLRADLDSGAWSRSHADLLGRAEMDYGYRIIVGGEELPAR